MLKYCSLFMQEKAFWQQKVLALVATHSAAKLLQGAPDKLK